MWRALFATILMVMSEHILPQWGFGGGWGGGWGGGPWGSFAPWWGIGTLVLLAAGVTALIVYLVRRPQYRQFGRPGAAPLSPAEDVLSRRFAAGEISEEEYLARLAVLRRPSQ